MIPQGKTQTSLSLSLRSLVAKHSGSLLINNFCE